MWTVTVPANRKALVPMAPERLRLLRKHLVASMRAMRTMQHPTTSATPVRAEPAGFAGEIARAACALCRGYCCKGGEEHAYLDERVMARVRLARPELDARAVLRLYTEHVPAEGYDGSCVFHGAQGCTLDRALRSDVCNSYFCNGLADVVPGADDDTRVAIVAGQGADARRSTLRRGLKPMADRADDSHRRGRA